MRFTKLLHIQIPPVTAQPNNIPNGLNYTAYGRLIQHCTDHRLIRRAKLLHAQLILSSVTLDNFLASKLITCYSKTNHLFYAHQVFDQIPHKNTFSWNALLMGYSMHNRYTDTLKLFSGFLASNSLSVKPDNYTVTCVLKALSSLGYELNMGRRFHSYIIRNGLDSDIFVVNALITFYCRCDEIVLARRLFNSTCHKDVVTWNAMIAGYSKGGFYDKCKELYFEMMGLEDVQPNEFTVISVLQACAQSNDLDLGMKVHRYVLDNEIKIDLPVCNAFIAMYAKCGSLEYAKQLFDEMSERDEISYGSIIYGYMLHGFVDKAMDLFREMDKPGLSTWNAVISGQFQNRQYEAVLSLFREMQICGFKPDTVTLSNIFPTLSQLSNLKGGKEMHAYAIRNIYNKNIYVATAIIDTYAKLGFLKGAEIVFKQSKKKSVIIYTSLISAYSAHGEVNAALDLFNNMINVGIQPDPVTFTSVLSACAHSGLVDEAWRIFNSMLNVYNIQPLMEHYACMVGVLSRALKLNEAVDFINKMPFEPSARVWGALLNGASVAGDVEVGKFACDRLFEIEPENTGNYVIMANLYSQAGRWEEAENVRVMLNDIGLKKIAGCSWIETPGGMQSFIAKDVSNENTEEIYATLGGLFEFMKDEKYAVSEDFH
ncbi:putative tetratricopeptide-like helical domain superfamily [Helianthus annuus]|uniref:Putative pentatricopeptide repeat (PPR) superfamily protein n=1 Tax=Helianthus annuus TaxID=4232 RepID=A0A251SUH8_HELAN|nr:pentatricopeptide repeat-containing protein At2g37310 [Helianthus annuus]KAF5773040.1 putative tetratricopeptide-like helical domain superfamily [Helianthus annuus]KAJ0480841.1 putative tetratricopeptide-like helical domain superfamily [Helianthus annuus]KAJ0497406.1 putative tetratricopeptide-like helical domain superfamily [Helianthus annuus]KAJ0670920.1 putative tetratricopeptide-like helical domain superfamily [Helianthus annuus]KAJ0857859.1 putative tetratricopeptide-like helical domai